MLRLARHGVLRWLRLEEEAILLVGVARLQLSRSKRPAVLSVSCAVATGGRAMNSGWQLRELSQEKVATRTICYELIS